VTLLNCLNVGYFLLLIIDSYYEAVQ